MSATEEIKEFVKKQPHTIEVPNKLKEWCADNGYTLLFMSIGFVITWIVIIAAAAVSA